MRAYRVNALLHGRLPRTHLDDTDALHELVDELHTLICELELLLAQREEEHGDLGHDRDLHAMRDTWDNEGNWEHWDHPGNYSGN